MGYKSSQKADGNNATRNERRLATTMLRYTVIGRNCARQCVLSFRSLTNAYLSMYKEISNSNIYVECYLCFLWTFFIIKSPA